MIFKLKNIKLLAIIIFFAFSCKKPEDRTCFKSTGDIIEETRPIDDFNVLQIDDALEIALYSQTANPNTAYAHTIVGNIYMEKKQYPEAIEAFESSLTLDPNQNGVKRRVEQAKAALAE